MTLQTRVVIGATLLTFMLLLGWVSAYHQRYYLMLSLGLAVLAMLPFFYRFERRSIHARELVLLAMLAAIAAVSRVPFAVLPSVQPTSFIIIISGWVLGAEAGFMIGAAAALVSNLFLGQGLWTPWQMFSWGFMGLTSGWFRGWVWLRSRWGMAAFGFIWGFLFGWLMNLLDVVTRFGVITWNEIWIYFAASFYFDLMHAMANAILLYFFGHPFLLIMTRFCRKYGILSSKHDPL